MKTGNDVHFLARGNHLTAIKADGLRLVDADGSVKVAKAEAAENLDGLDFDLVMVAVKSYSLADVSPTVVSLGKRGAVVLPLLNGVDAADDLVKAGVPRENVLGGVAAISAARTQPGEIKRFSPFARITIGEFPEASREGVSPRVKEIVTVMQDAGIDAVASPNIELDLWRKLAFIASFAATSGLARAAAGVVKASPTGSEIVKRAIEEAVAVGKSKGVAISDKDGENAHAMWSGLAPGIKPSLLLDVEKGGPNELAVLSGAVSRMGRELNVPTPTHDVAVALLGLI